MRLAATVILLSVCAVAGPMDRGSISPGGWMGLTGSWDIGDNRWSGSAGIGPNVEYAIADGLFVGLDLSLGGGFYPVSYPEPATTVYLAGGLGPSVRLCLSTFAPRPFIRLRPSGSLRYYTSDYTSLSAAVHGSFGLLVMLSHGVALEPALYAEWTYGQSSRQEGPLYKSYDLTAGLGVGLRSYIYR